VPCKRVPSGAGGTCGGRAAWAVVSRLFPCRLDGSQKGSPGRNGAGADAVTRSRPGMAVETLLADPEALGDDVLESCLYILRAAGSG
jgi:hypothetical protein